MTRALYEKDVVRWAQEQARLLREGDFAHLDIEHIADEIEDVGKADKRELASRTAWLLADPFDYSAYASEISRVQSELRTRAAQQGNRPASLKSVADASAQLTASASRASLSLRAIGAASLAPAKTNEINRALVSVEQTLLTQDGLTGRPWFKHTIYAPGSYAGYAAEAMPGVSESLDRNDPATLRVEADTLAAALRRAATRLDDVSKLARGRETSPAEGH